MNKDLEERYKEWQIILKSALNDESDKAFCWFYLDKLPIDMFGYLLWKKNHKVRKNDQRK